MLRDENRLGTQAISRIRQIRADTAPPRVPVVVYSATNGLPKGTRDRWTKLQANLTGTSDGSEHIVAEDTGHAIHQERPEQVATSIIRVVAHLR